MTSVDIFYPAIIVFSLLVVGLVLTVMEFNMQEKSAKDRDSDPGKNGK